MYGVSDEVVERTYVHVKNYDVCGEDAYLIHGATFDSSFQNSFFFSIMALLGLLKAACYRRKYGIIC